MQALARDGYTTEEIKAALTASDQTWGYGVDLLHPDLSVDQSITADVREMSIDRNGFRTVHGEASLLISRELRWGRDRIRPYLLLSSDFAGVTDARFNCGVYVVQRPDSILSEQPVAHRAKARDQIALLQYAATRSWSVTAGDNVHQCVRDVVAAAGLSVPVILASDKADAVVPAGGKVWPLIRPRDTESDDGSAESGYRWITIINELLTMIGYVGLYADWDGALRSEPATRAIDRPIDIYFDVDDLSKNVISDRTAEADVWDAYNRWVFYRSGVEGEPVEGVSRYTRDNLDVGPASQLQLGMVRQDVPQSLDAADYASLKTAGDAIADAAIAGTRTVRTSMSKMPVLWHRDTVQFSDLAAGAQRWRMVSTGWRLTLHDSSDQEVDWEVVTDAA